MNESDGERKYGLDHVSILNPIGETMRPKNSTEAPRKGVVDGLSDFTNLLSNTLGSFDSNIHSLQDDYAKTLNIIEAMKAQMDQQATKIKLLEQETEDQRDKIEQALHNVVKIEKNVDSQLTESTKQLHKEMVHQRTTTKMDINSLRGKLSSSMSEALSMFSDGSSKHPQTPKAYNPNSSTKESIEFLLEKIKNLEEAHTLQHSVNTVLSNAVAETSGGVIQKVYDSLFDSITELELQLADTKGENKILKDKLSTNVKELREATRKQEKQIEELTGALTSKNKMKRFKIEISKSHDKEERRGDDHRSTISGATPAPKHSNSADPSTSTSDPHNAADGNGNEEVELSDEEVERDFEKEERDRERDRRRRRRSTHHKKSAGREQKRLKKVERDTLYEDDEEEEEEDEDQYDENTQPEDRPARPSKIVIENKTRASFRPKRMTRNSVVSSDTPKPPIDPHAATALTEDETVATSPSSMLMRKGSASKVPNLDSIADADENVEEPNIDPKTKKVLRIPKRISTVPDASAYHSLSNIREGAEETEQDLEGTESFDGSFDGSSYSVGDSTYATDDGSYVREMDKDYFTDLAQRMVQEVKDNYEQRITDLEDTIVTLKRMTYVIDDLKINYDSMSALRNQVLSFGNPNHKNHDGNTTKTSGRSIGGDSSDGHDIKHLNSHPDFQALQGRFDVLATQFTDVQAFCKTYVPREEVHEAMKAVISEVKLLKKNCVPSNVFKEGLKMKADTEEVERLIKALSTAIGDLNLQYSSAQASKPQTAGGANVNIQFSDVSGAAAAMHQKCLICDKPVSQQRQRTAKTGLKPNTLNMSRSLQQIGYDKEMEGTTPSAAQQASLFNRLTSPSTARLERVKVQSELTIVRSSIDPLPDISDSISEYSPRGNNRDRDAAGSAPQTNNSNYKQRIRASAGGGVGPSYKMDTR